MTSGDFSVELTGDRVGPAVKQGDIYSVPAPLDEQLMMAVKNHGNTSATVEVTLNGAVARVFHIDPHKEPVLLDDSKNDHDFAGVVEVRFRPRPKTKSSSLRPERGLCPETKIAFKVVTPKADVIPTKAQPPNPPSNPNPNPNPNFDTKMSSSATTTTAAIISNGSFWVEVLGAGVQPATKENYVPVPHNTEYKLVLMNNWFTKADAEVKIDGVSAGKFRVNAQSAITISRPDHTAKNFTYLEEATGEFKEAKGEAKAQENGVIEVVFKPEREQSWAWRSLSRSATSRRKLESGRGDRGCDYDSGRERGGGSYPTIAAFGAPAQAAAAGGSAPAAFTHGMTALGSHSSQTFGSVSSITDIDTAKITKIVFRLVTAKAEPRFESMAAAAERAGVPIKTMTVPPRVD
jgi:hypothetical protein